jgi:hypothetical protein
MCGPFPCHKCDKVFDKKQNLERHLAKKIPCERTDDRFQCPDCPSHFSNKANCDAHQRKCHPAVAADSASAPDSTPTPQTALDAASSAGSDTPSGAGIVAAAPDDARAALNAGASTSSAAGNPILGSSLVAEHDGRVIAEMRTSDGYVDATKLCRLGGKLWANYFQNDKTTAFLEALNSDIGPITELVSTKRGGAGQVTWVHPQVAINLAMWVSPAFGVAVTRLVLRYASGQVTTAESQAVAARIVQRFTPQTSALHIESGDLQGLGEPGVYIIKFGDKMMYDMSGVPENAIVLGFGHAKTSGDARCREHRSKTGPATRVIDFVPTPYYELCEKQLEGRLMAVGRIVKAQIDGSAVVMREQFWTTLQNDDYAAVLDGLKRDAADLREKHERPWQLAIEQEKTKQAEARGRQSVEEETTKRVVEQEKTKQADAHARMRVEEEKTKQKALDFDTMKLQFEIR